MSRIYDYCEDAAREPEPDIRVCDTTRGQVVEEARYLIEGDRNNAYGPPTQDFQRTADMLNAMGYRGPEERELLPHDVAVIVITVKLSRLVWTPEKRDTWVDIAGYAGCGYECILAELEDVDDESDND